MLEKLEKILGYEFKNKNLLLNAVTHGSFSSDLHKNYERLEFLGDRVLGLAMALLLFQEFPEDKEGNLSPRHMRLVCKDTVARVALDLHINEFIRAENNYLKRNLNVLCDVMEAIIGAICIDSDIQEAVNFVDRNWERFVSHESRPQRDNKTILQELSHRLKQGNPIYTLLGKRGSDHEPLFYVKVAIENGMSAEGCGVNKKKAEQHAAGVLLIKLQEIGEDQLKSEDIPEDE